MKTIIEIIAEKKLTYKYFSETESIKAVEQNGYALRYVREALFETQKKMTINEIEKLLGFSIKIIK